MRIAMGEQQYILYLNIAFIPPRKPGRSLAYPLNPTHKEISVTDRKYRNNLYDYHLVKNINSALKKTAVLDIDKQWIKGAKYMMIRYANKFFVELMDWLYIRYGQITPGYLIKKKEYTQATYNVEDPTKILFLNIETG